MKKNRGLKRAVIISSCILLALLILLLGILFSQNKPQEVDPPETPPVLTGEMKVGFLMKGLLSEGTNGDIYNGIVLSGAESTYTESVLPEILEPSVESMYQNGTRVILINGDTELYTNIEDIASRYSEVTFLLFGTEMTNGSNLSSITYKYEDQGFIMGVLAALMSTSNSSGSIGEKDDEKIHDIQLGYSLGSMQINPDARTAAYIDGVDGDLAAHVEFFKSIGDNTIVALGSSEFLNQVITAGGGTFTALITDQDVPVSGEIAASCKLPVDDDISQVLAEIDGGIFAPGHYNKGAEILAIQYRDGVSDEVKNQIQAFIEEIKNGTLNVRSLGI